jgi:hypothetical protein
MKSCALYCTVGADRYRLFVPACCHRKLGFERCGTDNNVELTVARGPLDATAHVSSDLAPLMWMDYESETGAFPILTATKSVAMLALASRQARTARIRWGRVAFLKHQKAALVA